MLWVGRVGFMIASALSYDDIPTVAGRDGCIVLQKRGKGKALSPGPVQMSMLWLIIVSIMVSAVSPTPTPVTVMVARVVE